MSIFDSVLHVPAEGGRGGTERVQLPLGGRAGWRYALAGLVAGLVAAACLGVGTVLLVGDTPVFGLLVVAAGAIPAIVAGTAAHDLSQRQPVLLVKADGLLDRRVGSTPIFWDDVVEAELVRTARGVEAVRLRLAEDGEPAYNPCRFGAWTASWRERRRVRTVPLLLLDLRPHAAGQAILALVARGAEARR